MAHLTIYHELLFMFVSKEEVKPTLRAPFIQEEWAISANGEALIALDKSLLCGDMDFDSHPNPPNALGVIPDNNCEKVIKVSKLRNACNASKRKFKERYKASEISCADCRGTGQAEYHFYSSRTHKTHKLEGECPTCDGSGRLEQIIEIKTGDFVRDYIHEVITIMDAVFSRERVEILVKVAEMLQQTEITIVYLNHSYSKMKVKIERCTLVIMGMAFDDKEDELAVITNLVTIKK